MKTTIDLPDEILLKAKVLAAERRTTLKDLMIQGLRLVTQSPAPSGEKQRKAKLRRLLKAMKASNTEPMAPLKREELHDR
ncbi:MAG: hypothetical protein H7A52_11170 [Akkermansiaceae bacterium]|nr:hypothetical protein [Akkermansiaceae bacterium]